MKWLLYAILCSFYLPMVHAETASKPFWLDDHLSQEECRQLKSLWQQKKQIEHDQKVLQELKTLAEQAQKDAQEKIQALQLIEERLKAHQAAKKRHDLKRVKRLSKIYEGMAPAKAAAIMEKMEIVSVVSVLSLMDERKVAKILSNMSADLAMRISEIIARGGE